MKCAECDKPFKGRSYVSEFCSTPCRMKFNNRRATRGALLYDLVMRGGVKPFDTRVAKLFAHWTKEDNGRRTHQRPHGIDEATRFLNVETIRPPREPV